MRTARFATVEAFNVAVAACAWPWRPMEAAESPFALDAGAERMLDIRCIGEVLTRRVEREPVDLTAFALEVA